MHAVEEVLGGNPDTQTLNSRGKPFRVIRNRNCCRIAILRVPTGDHLQKARNVADTTQILASVASGGAQRFAPYISLVMTGFKLFQAFKQYRQSRPAPPAGEMDAEPRRKGRR